MKKQYIYSDELGLYIYIYEFAKIKYMTLIKDYNLATDVSKNIISKYSYIKQANKKFNTNFRIRKFEFLSWYIEDNMRWNINNWWKNLLLIWNEIKIEWKKEMKRIDDDYKHSD